MKILVVEDEPDLAASIVRKLHKEKYIVDWFHDGLEAWCYLETNTHSYSVAIFDWSLPSMSGIKLCKRLRQNSSSLPVLMLTAKDGMSDKVTGLDAGADDYLTKPFGMEELLARLRALQRRSQNVNIKAPCLQAGNLILDYSNYAV